MLRVICPCYHLMIRGHKVLNSFRRMMMILSMRKKEECSGHFLVMLLLLFAIPFGLNGNPPKTLSEMLHRKEKKMERRAEIRHQRSETALIPWVPTGKTARNPLFHIRRADARDIYHQERKIFVCIH